MASAPVLFIELTGLTLIYGGLVRARNVLNVFMIAAFGLGSWTAQLGGLVIIGAFTAVVTFVLIKVVAFVTPLRVDAETETNGLDLSVHGERAYDMSS